MATKTTKTATPAKTATKDKAKPAKAAKKPGSGPLSKVVAAHGSKDKLVDKLAPGLAGEGDDEGAIKERLGKASNQQLLRLAGVVDAVTKQYGSKDKLVAALAKALGKVKDKEYVARLGGFSLPRLYDLARSNERRAKAAASKKA